MDTLAEWLGRVLATLKPLEGTLATLLAGFWPLSGPHTGTVEAIGLRVTKIRVLSGAQRIKEAFETGGVRMPRKIIHVAQDRRTGGGA